MKFVMTIFTRQSNSTLHRKQKQDRTFQRTVYKSKKVSFDSKSQFYMTK